MGFSDTPNAIVWFSLRFYDFRGVYPYFPKYSKFSQARNFWWQILNLMKLIYLISAWKSDSFDVYFSIQISFFRVSFTIEPGCSLLQFVTTNCYHELSDNNLKRTELFRIWKGFSHPQRLALYTKVWLFLTTQFFKTIESFSIKSESLRRGEPLSYTE